MDNITNNVNNESEIQELKIQVSRANDYKRAFHQLEDQLHTMPFQTIQDLINVSKLITKIKEDFNVL
jgi:hypothetical protein